MGCYVNPTNMSKEAWLAEHGRQIPVLSCQITEDEVPVCLVNNGLFTAAGVAFSADELQAFIHPDGRHKEYFMVKREDLYAVSDLKNWE